MLLLLTVAMSRCLAGRGMKIEGISTSSPLSVHVHLNFAEIDFFGLWRFAEAK